MSTTGHLRLDRMVYLAIGCLIVLAWVAVGFFARSERYGALKNAQQQLDITVAALANANALDIAAAGTTADQHSDSPTAAIWRALPQFPTARFWVETSGAITAGEAVDGSLTEFVVAEEKRGQSVVHAALPTADALIEWRRWTTIYVWVLFAVSILIAFLSHLLARALRQRAKTEQEIAAARSELSVRNRTLEVFAQGVAITDRRLPGSPLIYVNSAYATLMQMPKEDILGRNMLSLYEPETAKTFSDLLRVVMRDGRTVWQVEFPMRRKDGSEIINRVFGSTIYDPDEQVRYAVMLYEDVTELKRREEMLREAQKMESVGQLTGGIAHDFNNLLTAVRSCAEDLRDELKDEYQKEQAEIILQASERGAALVVQLMAFARKQELQPKAVDVNAFLDAFSDLMRSTLTANVSVIIENHQSLSPIFVDPGRLETALFNLALNAQDAMPEGGTLRIEASPRTLDADYSATHLEVKPGEYVEIAVTDSGAGMPVHVLEKVFTPFFTTKEVGKGTGLGLSMVYGFVKQSGGHVRVYSEVSHGTVVKIYLPAQEPSSTSETATSTSPDTAIGNGGAILLVEDDPLVRQTIGNKLTSLGFQVVTATSAADAIDRLVSNDRFELVFSDIIMPGPMTGVDLVNEVRQRWPHIGILLTSGYTESSVLGRVKIPEGVRLLSKPYSHKELVDAIRRSLGFAA